MWNFVWYSATQLLRNEHTEKKKKWRKIVYWTTDTRFCVTEDKKKWENPNDLFLYWFELNAHPHTPTSTQTHSRANRQAYISSTMTSTN